MYDNKAFWEIVKPLLSKNIKSNKTRTLIENYAIFKVLNAFFSNIVQNLDIHQYNADMIQSVKT